MSRELQCRGESSEFQPFEQFLDFQAHRRLGRDHS